MGLVDVPWDPKVPWDNGMGKEGGTTCISVDGTGGCPKVPWDNGMGGTVGLLVYL